MVRLAGVDLAPNKRVEVALTYIYGIGDILSREILGKANIKPGSRVKELGDTEVLALREVGFNRGSMGVQDNDPVVQKAVHRIQPFEMTKQVVAAAKALQIAVHDHMIVGAGQVASLRGLGLM